MIDPKEKKPLLWITASVELLEETQQQISDIQGSSSLQHLQTETHQNVSYSALLKKLGTLWKHTFFTDMTGYL